MNGSASIRKLLLEVSETGNFGPSKLQTSERGDGANLQIQNSMAGDFRNFMASAGYG